MEEPKVKPWGNESRVFVEEGNSIASRFFLLCLIAVCRNTIWFIENPQSSRLVFFPVLKYLYQHRIRVQMGRWPET